MGLKMTIETALTDCSGVSLVSENTSTLTYKRIILASPNKIKEALK